MLSFSILVAPCETSVLYECMAYGESLLVAVARGKQRDASFLLIMVVAPRSCAALLMYESSTSHCVLEQEPPRSCQDVNDVRTAEASLCGETAYCL